MCECGYFSGHCPRCGKPGEFVKIENDGFAYCESCGICSRP